MIGGAKVCHMSHACMSMHYTWIIGVGHPGNPAQPMWQITVGQSTSFVTGVTNSVMVAAPGALGHQHWSSPWCYFPKKLSLLLSADAVAVFSAQLIVSTLLTANWCSGFCCQWLVLDFANFQLVVMVSVTLELTCQMAVAASFATTGWLLPLLCFCHWLAVATIVTTSWLLPTRYLHFVVIAVTADCAITHMMPLLLTVPFAVATVCGQSTTFASTSTCYFCLHPFCHYLLLQPLAPLVDCCFLPTSCWCCFWHCQLIVAAIVIGSLYLVQDIWYKKKKCKFPG